jgi:hypothetical protein
MSYGRVEEDIEEVSTDPGLRQMPAGSTSDQALALIQKQPREWCRNWHEACLNVLSPSLFRGALIFQREMI